MKSFTYYRPTTVEQAIGLLDSKWGKSELLAGGTDLLDLQKEYIAQPDKVISLGGIKDLKDITVKEDQITIDAGVTLAEIAEHPEIKKRCRGLASAAGEAGGPQLRNMGTLGGNLCQRNRCWYFRDEQVFCLLKNGDQCYARNGDNQYHAIFTEGRNCVSVHPSTLAPVLIALNARAEVQGPKGKRTIDLAKFFQFPEDATTREHVLAANEMVTSVTIPSEGLASASYEIRQKHAHDWPLVQAAVACQLNGGRASKVRIVLGHVAPIPHVAAAAAQALEGKGVTEETAAAVGKEATKGAVPLSGNAYKVQLVQVAVKRAILLAAGMKPYWES